MHYRIRDKKTELSQSACFRCVIIIQLSFAFLLISTEVNANIYSYRDENGITHFSTGPHLDRRYKLVYKVPEKASSEEECWRRMNFDHLCRFNIDQGLLLT